MTDPHRSETTQPSLLSRVRDPGDGPAWRDFDSKYRDLILRYGRSRGLQPSDAEDVRQMVMMSLARALRSFRYQPSIGRFRDYLGRIVRNAINRHLARPRAQAGGLSPELIEDLASEDSTDVDEVWDREWMHHHYRQAMIEVRRNYEERSVAMFEELLGGRSVAEVAASFGISQQAVHKVKQRIRDRLRELIEAQIREEDPDE